MRHLFRLLPVEFQDTFPARVKGLHLINQPWYVSMLLAIVRPFMKQKLRDRLTHGADLSSLHEYIDPEQLPAEFGGPEFRGTNAWNDSI